MDLDSIYSAPAEQAVLGILLSDATAWDAAAGLIGEHDFFTRDHRMIYRAMATLMDRRQPIDFVTVGEFLESVQSLDEVGGLQYLGQLAQFPPSAANLSHYTRTVREYSILRQVAVAARDISDAVHAREGRSAREILDMAQGKMMAVSEAAAGKAREFARMSELIGPAIQHIDEMASRPEQGEVTGLATGFVDLDRMTTGLHPGDLAIVAGRPSMGKTALALNVAQHVAAHGKAVAVFSLEMTSGQLVYRLLSGIAMLNQHRMKVGRLNDDEWARLWKAGESAREMPIWINEQGDMTVNELRAAARRLHREAGGLGLIVIDYLQLMRGDGRSDNRAVEVAEISRAIKGLAKELHCPVIALSQLNRGLESRPNKRPIMSDLRDSGGIEQDADLILMLYRDEYYNPDSPDAGLAEVIIGKQRNGPTGTVHLAFNQALTRFENRAPGPIPSLQEKTERRAARGQKSAGNFRANFGHGYAHRDDD